MIYWEIVKDYKGLWEYTVREITKSGLVDIHSAGQLSMMLITNVSHKTKFGKDQAILVIKKQLHNLTANIARDRSMASTNKMLLNKLCNINTTVKKVEYENYSAKSVFCRKLNKQIDDFNNIISMYK